MPCLYMSVIEKSYFLVQVSACFPEAVCGDQHVPIIG